MSGIYESARPVCSKLLRDTEKATYALFSENILPTTRLEARHIIMPIIAVEEHATEDWPQTLVETLKEKETSPLENNIITEINFIVRDPKYENEKPYDIRYDIGPNVPRTNIEVETKSVNIQDFRPLHNSESFHEYGFSFEKLDFALTEALFDHQSSIKEVYYPAIEKLLRRKFPDAAEVHILEHNVRMNR